MLACHVAQAVFSTDSTLIAHATITHRAVAFAASHPDNPTSQPFSTHNRSQRLVTHSWRDLSALGARREGGFIPRTYAEVDFERDNRVAASFEPVAFRLLVFCVFCGIGDVFVF